MIRYALVCKNSHEFESWFQNSDAFDAQACDGLVTCPLCHSSQVKKAIMAPAIGHEPKTILPPNETSQIHVLPEVAKAAEIRALLRQLRDKITEGVQDVGTAFATEARKIQDGDAPERAIIGRATQQEAHELIDEGIAIMPLPMFPDERN